MAETTAVIDASGCVAGRLASIVAKRLLLGEKVDVVNAEKAIISGDAFAVYKKKTGRGSRDWGPFIPTKPDMLFRRIVRGMLPFKNARGRDAFERLRVHAGMPTGFSGRNPEVMEKAKPKSRIHEHVPLAKLSGMLRGGK